MKLQEAVFNAAYAPWKDNSIIVVGGQNGAELSDKIQIVGSNKTWTMNETTVGSCLVNLHDDTFLLVSGLNIGWRSIIITPSLRNGKLTHHTAH